MSDPDRRFDRQGLQPPLTIDRDRRPRARGPAPVTLIVSLLMLVVIGGAVAYMYRSGARSPNDAPRPLGVPVDDVRGPAPVQPRAADPGAGLTISKDDPNVPPQPPVLAPPPEQPLPEPPATASKALTLPPAATPRPPAEVKPEQGSDPIGGLLEQPVKPKVAKDVTSTTEPVVVQIGAFSSERLADKEWSKAAAVAPGVMAGKGKRVVPVTKDGATLYRTSITGFVSHDQAMALCVQLKASGGSCFVR